jgi:hypothetical protein
MKDARLTLDCAVRAAYQMAPDINPVQSLFDLNQQLSTDETGGKGIVGPGLPPTVTDLSPFISGYRLLP